MSSNVVLLINCPDQPGIVAKVSNFLFANGANIIDSQQHSTGLDQEFFMRIAFEASNFKLSPEDTVKEFEKISSEYKMNYSFNCQKEKKKMGVLVSKYDHCLYDILLRQKYGELNVEIPLIISNHKDLEPVAKTFSIPFKHVPVDLDAHGGDRDKAKKASEAEVIKLMDEANVELVALARYMQILTEGFIEHYPYKIINVHHGFLPAFKGAKPYHQAYEKGVKVIGATAHYATKDLDMGPIIDQDVIRVNHRDDVEDYLAKGRDIEKMVFANALKAHANDKVIVCHGRTIVFE